jgi:NADPH:quinone reductase
VPELLQLIFMNQAVLGFAAGPLLTPQVLNDDLSLLFELATQGQLKVHLGGRFALADVADAHRALSSRSTIGKLVLLP